MESNLIRQPHVRSPYIDMESTGTGKLKIHNQLSGRAFEVGEGIGKILRFYDAPRSFDEVAEQFPLYGNKLGVVCQYLTDQRLIFPADDPAELVTDRVAVAPRLFDAQPLTESDVTTPVAVCLGVPFGKGNGKSMGSAEFPQTIRAYTQRYGLATNRLAQSLSCGAVGNADVTDRLKKLFKADRFRDGGNLFVSALESPAFIYEKLYAVARKLLRQGHVPVTIGGDHSISYPLIRAAAETYPNLHVLHFDAHTDTYSSRYDALPHAGRIHHYGNFMSYCLALPTVAKVYQFGIRGLTNACEQDTAKRQIIWADEARTVTLDLPNDVPYYVTFDIDVLDPSVAPGTASPVANGLTYAETTALFERLLPGKRIIGLDLVEMNPDFDRTELTTEVAVSILLQLLSYIPLMSCSKPDSV
ncbi:arginase family protein [Spirosoma validum]|uniref:Arginase family protein n=1 Tax=Spirosoma validum TaxID=2771355 RepID=A0A927B2J5_9BACT|nr:arginase family protein [Spirosoma validum]MBD2754082.1 arginase family protein [Spirosoma validum]